MIVVTACFRSETRAIRPRTDVRVIHTAMGERAALDAARLVREQPALLLSTGFCGALASDLRLGDLALADEIRVGDGTVYMDCAFVERARAALDARGLAPRVGPEACMPEVTSASEKRKLAAGGALAVDLESAALARWASRKAIPFVSLRVVLDTANEDVHFSRRVPLWVSVLRHPVKSVRVGRAAGIAALRLGAAVDCLADAWGATT
jgi:4-hydroxy-3-methylbut-2-enyl diphosphate reductase